MGIPTPLLARQDLLELATELAHNAGALLLEGLERSRAEVSTKSSGTDMVTEMDRASEAFLVEGITRSRPDDAIIGEEGASRSGSSGVRWIVDPLDGTTNYLYGYPAFAVSIAVEVGDEPAVGVVHDPIHGETFSAIRGLGARREGAPVRVTALSELSQALVGTGFGYRAELRAHQAAVLTRVLPEVRDIRRGGAASLDLCWAACGRLDVFYERGLAPWDRAAGALIAAEAGAEVRLPGEVDGLPDDLVVAAPPRLMEPFRRLLVRAHGHGA